MNLCPCCDELLLRQFRQHRLTLFCPGCWQETPLANSELFAAKVVAEKVVAEKLVEKVPAKVVSLNQVRSQNLQRILETA
jgi:hypothetical protein